MCQYHCSFQQRVQPHEQSIAVANWLTEQRPNDYSDISNDGITLDGVVVVDLMDEGSPTGGYSGRSRVHLERDEMVAACRVAADYCPRIDEFAGSSLTRLIARPIQFR